MGCVRRWVMALGLSLAAAAAHAPASAEERARQEERLRQAGLLARVELALERLDYPIDAPDGLPDARTDAALAHFRGGAGLPTVGRLDEALVVAVEAAAGPRPNDASRSTRRGARRRHGSSGRTCWPKRRRSAAWPKDRTAIARAEELRRALDGAAGAAAPDGSR